MQTVGEGCPLFTSRHGHHSAVWTIPGFSIPRLCIACAIERLENASELFVHVRKVLAELRALLGTGEGRDGLLQTLSSDRQVLDRLCCTLFGEARLHAGSSVWPLCTRARVGAGEAAACMHSNVLQIHNPFKCEELFVFLQVSLSLVMLLLVSLQWKVWT